MAAVTGAFQYLAATVQLIGPRSAPFWQMFGSVAFGEAVPSRAGNATRLDAPLKAKLKTFTLVKSPSDNLVRRL